MNTPLRETTGYALFWALSVAVGGIWTLFSALALLEILFCSPHSMGAGFAALMWESLFGTTAPVYILFFCLLFHPPQDSSPDGGRR